MDRAVASLCVCLALGVGAAGLGGCAEPCEDDGFGQNCALASGDGTTGGTPSSSGATAPSTSTSGSSTPSTSQSGSGDASTMDADASTSSMGADASTSSSTGTIETAPWCTDADADGYGDPDDCVDVPLDEDPPGGTVDNADDCDDTADDTHPGAATEKTADACTKDSDGDGWGDASPPAGVDAGTDCDDDSDFTYPGAAEDEAELCARDEDDDGWGDDDPPAGVDAGTDCIDVNEYAFPGAAENDDAVACMEDEDEDGYGDSMPPVGALAGTDCDDGDTDVPASVGCFVWCNDADSDQYGDAADCVFDTAPPAGYVGNDTDCDDDNANAFPGAAPNDDATACMEDEDGDDYGDENPPAGVDAGTDCDDLIAALTDNCIPCTPGEMACNIDEDLTRCNDNGTFPDVIEDCLYGCDDVGLACWMQLTVTATADGGSCADTTLGNPVDLEADAAGGDGSYTYAWTPAASLDDATSATPQASPSAYTVYTVDVTDGESNAASDSVSVHVTDAVVDLSGANCADYVYPDPFGNAATPDPDLAFFSNSQVMCNLSNTLPHAYVCDDAYEGAVLTWRMQVTTPVDDDVIGFVWGWQNPGQFYVLSWKQQFAFAVFGFWFEGITIKRIDAPDQGNVTADDLFGLFDTANSTLLETPFSFHGQGWDDNTEYTVTLTLDGANHTIDIDEFATGTDVAEVTIVDATYPSGAVGFFDASQEDSCAGFLSSACL